MAWPKLIVDLLDFDCSADVQPRVSRQRGHDRRRGSQRPDSMSAERQSIIFSHVIPRLISLAALAA
jgi:hypothetical protein